MLANTTMPVAAIVHAGKGEADGVLLDFIATWSSRGRIVLGLVPGARTELGGGSIRTLRDLDSGRIYPISQNLGKGSSACSLDASALLAAAGVLHDALHREADLVVVNRFGMLEADGGGFAQEMLALMASGRPMLTVVSGAHLQAWRRFTGGLAVELPPQREPLAAWADSLPDRRLLR